MIGQGHRPEVIVHASSSGGTQAGLLAGLALTGLKTRVIGIGADEPATQLVAWWRTSNAICSPFSSLPKNRSRRRSAILSWARVTAFPPERPREAQRLLARSEALLVDHTYTAKALAGLISLVREGSLPAGTSILFWHTGGQVGVLA